MTSAIKPTSKASFFSWFNANGRFVTDPIASKKWDKEVTSSPAFSDALINSRSVKKVYKQIEAQIIHDYADLLDIQLRSAFQQVNRNEVANPVGFSNIERASPELKSFFECRKIFENFIADDITGHDTPNAQLMAFARWVNIAKVLLKKHNYEAFSLVVLRLSQIDMQLKLSNQLPENTKNTLRSLDKLIFPSKNFKDMREYIRTHEKDNDFPPTFLISKDMTFLNEALGDDKKLNSKEISKRHPSYVNVVRKEKMLNKLFSSKQDQRVLPLHLQATFALISGQYAKQNKEDNLSPPSRKRSKSADNNLPKHQPTMTEESDTSQRPRSKSVDESKQKSRGSEKVVPEEQRSTPHSKKMLFSFWQEGCKEAISIVSSLTGIPTSFTKF